MTGPEFRALRRELGLSAAGMAGALGMAADGERTIRRWQVAGPPPPVATAVALLVALRRHPGVTSDAIAAEAAAISAAEARRGDR